jgi:putative transposase
MTELKSRGVEDILIAVVDGLKGFPEAIAACSADDRADLHRPSHPQFHGFRLMERPQAAELKAIYRATDAYVARRTLEDFNAGVWGRKYPAIAP